MVFGAKETSDRAVLGRDEERNGSLERPGDKDDC